MTDKPVRPASIDQHDEWALIRRLLTEYGLPQWRRYALAFAIMGVGAGCTALAAYLMGSVINEAFGDANLTGVIEISAVAFCVFAMRGLTMYWHSVLLSRIGNSIIAENQRRVFAKLLQHNLSFYADRHSSEFTARLSTGAASATQVLNLLITTVGRDLATLIGLVTVMVIQDPIMSLCAVVIAPPAAIMIRKLTKRVRAVARNQWTGGARTIETMQEALHGVRIVKAFTLEPTMTARFNANVADVERESNKMTRVGQRVHPLMETLGGLAITMVMVYAGYRVSQGASAGEFFSFVTAFLFAYEPAKRLARLNIDLTAALVGVRILFEIIDDESTEPNDDDKPALVARQGRVEFSKVRFAYPNSDDILHDLSLVAEPEQVTALVGSNGAGKSTILNLIPRFYEVGSGTITIDGIDTSGVSRRSLRQQITYVSQEVFLFRATIRENIAFGKPGATEDEIITAAKAAHAHDFIMSFPAGYDTQVGEHGYKLSGGQRQRISIARALIKQAPIILLDEATAALDAESEHHVQQAVAELTRGRTTIVIAHRLSTIMHADRILVIAGGSVVESGKHDELLHKDGRYASFYRLQLRHQKAQEAPALAADAAAEVVTAG